MALRYKGRAEVDPENPRAFGICNRCGFQHNLYMLNWQFAWMGPKIIRKNILVCSMCMDDLAEFMRTAILPIDPPPLFNVRPEPYDIDEAGSGAAPPITTVYDVIGAGSTTVTAGYAYARLQVVGGAGIQLSKYDGSGGGAWATSFIRVVMGDVLYWNVGGPEQPSWIRKNVNAPPTLATEGCLAACGVDVLGGDAANCVGDICYSGGRGGPPGYGNGGGGGAGGPLGPGGSAGKGAWAHPNNWGGGSGGGGANGGASTPNMTTETDGEAGGVGGVTGSIGGLGGTLASQAGKVGSLGAGGGGGYGNNADVGDGGPGCTDTAFDATHGCGGGGGGAGSSALGPARTGGDGGLYGGGSGGGDLAAGAPARGCCVIGLT